MLKIAPVSKPTAKKEKYMIAAGCFITDESKGGSLKSTGALLFRPIKTKSAKIAVTKTVLINIIMFITIQRGSSLRGHAGLVMSSRPAMVRMPKPDNSRVHPVFPRYRWTEKETPRGSCGAFVMLNQLTSRRSPALRL